MKKKLIALALIALPAVAMADVTLYGIMKIGMQNTGTDFSHDNDTTTTGIDDYGSRVGIKGEEDLGNGLKAIWQVESAIRLDGNQSVNGSGGTFSGRDTFVGLDMANFGKVRLGRLSTELNSPLSMVDIWEYDSHNANNANGLLIFTRTGDRLNNAIRYDSPDWYGFNFNLIYGFGENSTSTAANVNRRYISGLGLNYENSGFFGSYGYEQRGEDYLDDNGNAKTGYVHRLEFGYNANNLFVGLGYQYAKEAIDSTWVGSNAAVWTRVDPAIMSQGFKTSEFVLSTSYAFGPIKPKFTYAHAVDVRTQNASLKNTKYDQYILGVDYALSKRTTAGLSVGQARYGRGLNPYSDENFSSTTYGMSLIHKF